MSAGRRPPVELVGGRFRRYGPHLLLFPHEVRGGMTDAQLRRFREQCERYPCLRREWEARRRELPRPEPRAEFWSPESDRGVGREGPA